MLKPGDVIEEFTLETEIGVGGFGVVWRASDANGYRVAVKVVRHALDADMRHRLEREAAALRRLDHPNCVRYLKAGARRGQPYIITEFVDGEELGVWASRGRSLGELLSVCAQIADCLAHTHRSGVVHRDLKPANVLVLPEGAVKVIDFGISKIIGRQGDITKTGEVVGTAGFMSPEQLRGEPVGPATDQYALGTMMFELLEGRPPFAGPTALAVSMAHLNDPVPSMSAGGTVRRRATGVPFAREGRRGPLRVDG